MKLKSLILGSVAAAGLSTAGYAADLGVLTSLDVCDSLGISGLTISSSTNCLQITGAVSYAFSFGQYRGATAGQLVVANTPFGAASSQHVTAGLPNQATWESKVEAWLKFVATSSTDFGPAAAHIKLKSVEQYRYVNGSRTAIAPGGTPGATFPVVAGGDNTNGVDIDEAFVQIGDTTTILAGKKGSIANFGNYAPFNFTGLFGVSAADGAALDKDADQSWLGGHVIQVVSNVGNGLTLKAGFENIGGKGNAVTPADAGTLVGVVEYAGNGISANATGVVIGVLDGTIDKWAAHAGATGTFDKFKVRGALGYFRDVVATRTDFHAVLSAEATFDLFKVALSGEYAARDTNGVVDNGVGIGGSIGATVSQGVSINLGARYFTGEYTAAKVNRNELQVAAQLIAALSETVTVTAEVGGFFNSNVVPAVTSVGYASTKLEWKPSSEFTSSVTGEANTHGAYKVTFAASKSFK